MTTSDQSDSEIDNAIQPSELKVTFYPPLVFQRRIWILDILRAQQVTEVLDIGCGEGQLLSVLCQPAPWLSPPPPEITQARTAPYREKIPNLHPTRVLGLDLCAEDLAFAVEGTTPPKVPETAGEWSYTTTLDVRWEPLDVKVWLGGLEQVNESFVDVQCIVSTEVIEHLTPEVFPAFAPMLLGVYHPEFLLITTPSYTFNARFTAPDAPPSARKGFPDPTKRTDRIFRHPDHKFEWTVVEFEEWCKLAAEEWGYQVEVSSVGRAQEVDEWGRDEELGGATQVALFKRQPMDDREARARDQILGLKLSGDAHKLLAEHQHTAQLSAKCPQSLEDIATCVKATMEDVREEFMRVEQLWYERKLAEACGGWLELLIAAVEQCEYLELRKGEEDLNGERGNWTVSLVGGFSKKKERVALERAGSSEPVLRHWFPEEDSVPSSEEETGGEYTDIDGDISRDVSDTEGITAAADSTWSEVGWGSSEGGWGEEGDHSGWLDKENSSEVSRKAPTRPRQTIHSSTGSTTGWEGDESEDVI